MVRKQQHTGCYRIILLLKIRYIKSKTTQQPTKQTNRVKILRISTSNCPRTEQRINHSHAPNVKPENIFSWFEKHNAQ